MVGDGEDIRLPDFDAGNLAGSLDLAVIGKWDQTVDAVTESGLSAAGRAQNEHLFAAVDRQIDIVQRKLVLGFVAKRKVLKFDNRLFHRT